MHLPALLPAKQGFLSGVALLAALLAFAPLIKGGNRPLPLIILESAAVVLLCLLLTRPHFGNQLPVPCWQHLRCSWHCRSSS